jgi:dipeptidyl aminopeptidase/acylaminoacyl peptidase
MKTLAASIAMVCGFTGVSVAQTSLTYQKAPDAIEKLLDAPPTPVVKPSPDGLSLLVEQPQGFPSIAELAQPRLRLAGIRFNPANNGPSRDLTVAVQLSLQSITGGTARSISGLPAALKATHLAWSPDSKHVAFVQKAASALELWVVDVAAPSSAHRVGSARLNAVLGEPCQWLWDSTALLCKIVPAARGAAPTLSDVPQGPNVEENLGKVTPAWTYEDLLKTPADEAVFEYYANSDLAVVSLDGTLRALPVQGLIRQAEPSPDGRYALVELLHRPFSYALPEENFPAKASLITLATGAAKELSDHPLLDTIPTAFDAVQTGPRDYQWRSDAPATLVWTEAQDGGDPKTKTAVRDRLMALAAPFSGKAELLLTSPLRIRSVDWGTDRLAIAGEWRWSDRQIAFVAFDPNSGGEKSITLYAGSSQDRYHSPGKPVSQTDVHGKPALKFTRDGKGIYFFSPGATPDGDLPFVAVMPAGGGSEQIRWRSAPRTYADPIAILPNDQVLVRQESETISPNYFAAKLKAGSSVPGVLRRLTAFPSPYADLRLPSKKLLKYQRADGLELTATLWLPAGYDKAQGPLPTLVEAYPSEFKTRAAAGQVSGSPFRFPRIGWGSPVYFAQTGYAVLENASIPIVGEGDAQPNDTYVEQLVAGAKAAIDAGAALGVVDPKRVAVMGHSYGAFMTANLLAHSDLFRAGIARSGAYNRTLTPFGFQAEQRTYWEAPDVYAKMSPFSYADKIKTPILLIHGEADDNQGTFPIQSERFYVALKGHGATVRLVFLPLEAHGYQAHESLSHMLWEMNRWLDTYVKPKEPITAKP